MSTPDASPAAAAPAAATPIHAAPPLRLYTALFVVALALRPQISAIGPLVPGILDELHASHAFVGLLTAVPVLCMGVFALVGPAVAARAGTRGGVAVSVGILVASGIARAVAPGAELVLLATFGVGVGTAVVGPILPMFVRDRIPGQMVSGTSSYAAGTILGAAAGAALAVPLASLVGGWRGSLLAISVASAGCVAAWLWGVARRRSTSGVAGDAAPARVPARLPRLPLRRGVAWAIGLLFGLQSWLYYGTTAWLASVYLELGWDAGAAAALLALVSLASLVAIVAAPWGARHGLTRRTMLTSAALLSTTGLLGVAIVPGPGVLWGSLLGAGLGLMFTLLLTLPTDISDDPVEVGGAAALMLLVGYLLASVAPFALGAWRDATGNFSAGLWALVAIAVAMVPLSWSLTPERLHRRTAQQAG